MYFERGEVEQMSGDKNEVEDMVPVFENVIVKLQRTHVNIKHGWEAVK